MDYEHLYVINWQIDKLATDVVMQAASGSYKPVSLVEESAADEPMDTEFGQHNTVSTEQSNVLSSCVCFVACCFV